MLIGSDPYQLITSEFQFEQWYAPDSLNIESTLASFRLNLDSYSISLGIQNRAIELFTILGAPKNRLLIKSQDLLFSVDYFGFEDWLLSLNIINYSYSNNVNISEIKPIVLLLLQPSALSLASGFEDKSTSLKISYLMGTKQLSLIYTESESAVDDSQLSSHTLEWSNRYNNETMLLLSYGKSRVSGVNSTSEFYNISIAYYFY